MELPNSVCEKTNCVNGAESLKEKLAQSGINLTDEQKDLLVRYANGMDSVNTSGNYPKENPVKEYALVAFKGMLLAAVYGIADAQYLLGLMYEKGHGTVADNQKAFDWYQKAAEQGQPEAQNNLALMYVLGKGLLEDDQKAF